MGKISNLKTNLNHPALFKPGEGAKHSLKIKVVFPKIIQILVNFQNHVNALHGIAWNRYPKSELHQRHPKVRASMIFPAVR